ncbi:hypothetical protein GCM10009845_16970 [Pedococcus bigeumensis]
MTDSDVKRRADTQVSFGAANAVVLTVLTVVAVLTLLAVLTMGRDDGTAARPRECT